MTIASQMCAGTRRCARSSCSKTNGSTRMHIPSARHIYAPMSVHRGRVARMDGARSEGRVMLGGYLTSYMWSPGRFPHHIPLSLYLPQNTCLLTCAAATSHSLLRMGGRSWRPRVGERTWKLPGPSVVPIYVSLIYFHRFFLQAIYWTFIDGWVYTNDSWLAPQAVSSEGMVTRRRRWVRRVWYRGDDTELDKHTVEGPEARPEP